MDDFISEINSERGSGWWKPEWKFRRKCTLQDPRLELTGQDVFLTDPDPLLLFNTRTCAPALADLRAVGLNGETIPCGVSRFGQDDGLSLIWLRPAQPVKPPFVFYLYYGNPAAEPAAEREAARVPEERDRFQPLLAAEETAPGFSPAPPSASLFDKVVVVEAEDCVTARGKPSFTYDPQPPQMAWLIKGGDDNAIQKTASAGAYLASTCPWRPQQVPEPIVAWTKAVVPEEGRWTLHVRYKVTGYHPASDRGKGGQPTQERYVPFELTLGGKTLVCGTNQANGAIFRWDRFDVELPAGETEFRIRMAGMSAPDCFLLTKNPSYQPDHRDFNGPVWMRFRVPGKSFGSYYAELFCVITPWSSHGPQGESAGFLLRDQVVQSETDLGIQIREPAALIQPGEWSPWIEALHSTMRTWWSQVRFFPAGRPSGKGGAADLAVDFEFATRPDSQRVYRTGTEKWEKIPGLHVLMPQQLSWDELNRRTLSFSQWARQRFDFVKSLNLAATRGPEEILVTTMATSVNTVETDYILRTCGLLGFNGIDMRHPMGADAFAKAAASNGLTWSTAHHWAPKFGLADMPDAPRAGQTCLETLREFLQQQSKLCYAPGPRWGPPGMPVKLLIMGDEIGPATSADFINLQPLLRGTFRDYLKAQGLTPGFFGKKEWSEVDAFSYRHARKGSESADAIVAYRKARNLPPDPALEEVPPPMPDTLSLANTGGGEDDIAAAEEQRQADERLAKPADPAATLEEKRLYHWTQRFRSFYTCVFYGEAHAQLQRQAVEMKWPWKPLANPNFQAMPVMCGQMWDGALNLFDWARSGTTDFLFMEDWINGPYRVAFGQRLLSAAGRKKGQKQGALIVADNAPRQRYLMSVGNGGRAFLSYVYGPLQVIGPAWAENEKTTRAWADTLAWTGHFEKELLQTRMRPAEAALLIANTSEINTPYLSTSVIPSRPLNERQAVFATLMDAAVPVELVGEEEIIEDGALGRYKALYVADPHVDSRAQEKIKEWVRAGGVLWGSHAALAREEYDTTTPRFDEVFGLAERGALVQLEKGQGKRDPSQGIRVSGKAPLPDVAFDAYPIRPAWKVGTAEVLASFADNNAPALLHNRFGKGNAYLFANSALACNAGYDHSAEEPEWAARSRELVAIAAKTAKVQPQVALSHARVLWTVQDGPDFSILTLANCNTGRLDGLKVELYLPRKPAAVEDGRGQSRAFEWLGDRARITLDLDTADGAMLLFR